MDTIVYIDGYNLFYGRLRGTNYKWLDIFKLFETIAHIQNPLSQIVKIKFFTAPVKANFSSHGQLSVQSQERYHRALLETYKDKLEIIKGFHTVERGFPPKYKKPIDKNDRVEIWQFEEKQSDVNIALHMYRDAASLQCQQQILVSNDSDLELALKLIKQDFKAIELGLVIPRQKPNPTSKHRPTSSKLSQYTDWTRSYISDFECSNSQLPNTIPTRRKAILKPTYW